MTKTLRHEILFFFLMVLSVLLLTSAGFDTSEGVSDYEVAHQILTQGSLSFRQSPGGSFSVAPNGRWYCFHEFGNTLFLLPVACFNVALERELAPQLGEREMSYATGFCVTLVAPVYCAAAAALFYTLLRSFFLKSASTTLHASLAFTFCTFVWTYSRNLFDGVLCMALLTGAMLAMMQFRKTKDTRLFLVATGLFGFGVITRLSMLLALAAFGVYLAISFWGNRARLIGLVLLGGIELLPFAAWQIYYNHLRTGNWLLSPILRGFPNLHGEDLENPFTGDLLNGLSGLLFSPGKSIFLYCPLALFSVFCFRRFWTSHKPEAAFLAVLSVLWLVLHAKLVGWSGDWGWGPRYFITIAPVLALPVCVFWESMKQNTLRRSFSFLVLGWGAILSLASIIGNWHFRRGLAQAEGRDGDIIWSLRGGQALDMVVASASNLRNMIWHFPGPTLPEVSAVNTHASNTINVWLNSAAFLGVPLLPLVCVALALVSVAAYCFVALQRLIAREDHESHEPAG